MFRQLYAVTKHTCIESLRQQVFIVVLLLVVGLLLLNPALSKFTLDDDNKLLIDLGFSTLLLGGVVLAAFSAAAVLRRELEEGTVEMVLTKPVPRSVFVVGKYLGIAGSTTLALWVWALVYLLTLRHGVLQTARDPYDGPVLVFGVTAGLLALGFSALANYWRSTHFGATLAKTLAATLSLAYLLTLTFSKDWQPQPLRTDLDREMLAGLLLIFETLWVFCAVGICAATRLGQISTLVALLLVFLAGLSSDYTFGRLAESSSVAHGLYTIVPNLQFLWLADALTQGRTVSSEYVLLTSAYSLLLVLGILSVAVALLHTEQAR